MTHSPEPREGFTPLQLTQIAQRRLAQYRLAAERQHVQAMGHLDQAPPNYSAAATACHRAHQFYLQAQALEQLARDAGLW